MPGLKIKGKPLILRRTVMSFKAPKNLAMFAALAAALLVGTVLLIGCKETEAAKANPEPQAEQVKTCCPPECVKVCCEAKKEAGTCPAMMNPQACPAVCPEARCLTKKQANTCPAEHAKIPPCCPINCCEY